MSNFRTLPRLAAASLLALLPAAASAQVAFEGAPARIDYQGQLLNSIGGPITGSTADGSDATAQNFEIRFRVWDAQTGGNLIWAERQVVTVTEEGFFSVQLGEGETIDTADSDPLPLTGSVATGASALHDVFDGEERYLGVTVLNPPATPGEIQPRLRFLSVPFAVVANRALTVPDAAIDGSKIAAGAVASGHIAGGAVGSDQLATDAVTSVQLAAGAVTSIDILDGAITAADLDGGIGVWSRTGGNIFYTGTGVGIGTNNPQAPLHVRGSARIAKEVSPDTGPAPTQVGDSYYLSVGGNESTNGSYRLIGLGKRGASHMPAFVGYQERNSGPNTFGDLVFGTRSTDTDTAPAQRMRILSDGNVVIGGADFAGSPLEIVATNDIGDGDGTGMLAVGASTGFHLALDSDEIQSSNGNGVNSLHLNRIGGNVFIGRPVIDSNTFTQNFGRMIIKREVPGGSVDMLTLETISAGHANDWTIRVSAANVDDEDLEFWQRGNFRGAVDGSTGGFVNPSDRRLKDRIEALQGSLDMALALKPSRYVMKESPAAGTKIGFIAQDVLEVAPELVARGSEYLGLNYGAFGVIAIGAIQELKAEKDAGAAALRGEVEDLRAQNRSLEGRLQRLERMLSEGTGAFGSGGR